MIDIRAKLTELKALHEDGLISEQDFQHQRGVLLEQLTAQAPVDAEHSAAQDFAGGVTDEFILLPALGSKLNNRYRLEAEAGKGGMGVVYKAEDEMETQAHGVPRYVAIKLLNPAYLADSRYRKRFQREAGKARCLTHDNIVKVFTQDEHHPWPFLVMEWLEGQTLNEHLGDFENGFSLATIKPWLQATAKALDYAHRYEDDSTQGIIHRDIKPGNLYLTNRERLVVLDFGIARVINESRMSQSIQLGQSTTGTMNYMPPEAFVGGYKAQSSDDFYGLAVTTYELLTGSVPFTGPLLSARNEHSSHPHRPEGLSDNQWQLLVQALHYDPALRPKDLLEWVEKFCDDVSQEEVSEKEILTNSEEHTHQEHDRLEGDDLESSKNEKEPIALLETEEGDNPIHKTELNGESIRRTPKKKWPVLLSVGGAALIYIGYSFYPSFIPDREVNKMLDLSQKVISPDSENPEIPEITAIKNTKEGDENNLTTPVALPPKEKALVIEPASRAEEAKTPESVINLPSEPVILHEEQVLKTDQTNLKVLEIRELEGIIAQQIAANRLSLPVGNNALENINKLEKLDVDKSRINSFREQVANRYIMLAKRALDENDMERAKEYELKAINAYKDAKELLDLRNNIENYQSAKITHEPADVILNSLNANTDDVEFYEQANKLLKLNKPLNPQQISRLEKNASLNDAYAQAVLGRALFLGLGVDKNVQRSVDLIQKSALQGNGVAQKSLSFFYLKGVGLEQSDTKAVEWVKRSVDSGYVDAEVTLGWMYEYGQGVKQSDTKALGWYRKAAEKGNADAQVNMGLAYYNGMGVDKNYATALLWLLKSAKQGNSGAQNQIGVMYRFGNGVEIDYAEAIKWFRKSAVQDYGIAANNLASMYKNGLGVAKSDDKAVEWLVKAAGQGIADAQNDLGWAYQSGLGIGQNYKKAVEWYVKSAEQGNATAQKNLGWAYADGLGVVQNYEKAAELYRKSAANGSDSGANRLGNLLLQGRGGKQSDTEAAEWFRKAALMGSNAAQHNIGWMYDKGRGVDQSDTKAMEWYLKSSKNGYLDAYNQIGLMYGNGRGVEQSYEKAVEWYRKAAEQGNVPSQTNLGLAYEEGQGVEQNTEKAVEWFRKAVRPGNARLNGYATAQRRLKILLSKQ